MIHLKTVGIAFFVITSFPFLVQRPEAAELWSEEAHHYLLRSAFESEDPNCVTQMQDGSDDIDSLINQLKPELSYQHAMRAPGQSASEASELMQEFIRITYDQARLARDQGHWLTSCFMRGQALHPLMDSTSPVHEGFQEWHIKDAYKHGDSPFSQETLKDLINDPMRLNRTIELMQKTDQALF